MQFQKKSTPMSPHVRSSEIVRGKGKKVRSKVYMKLNWNFLEGSGVAKQKTLHGGSVDISWNCTMVM